MSDTRFSRILLTHAVLEGSPQLHVPTHSIGGYHHSAKLNCTYVYCTGQNIFPAKETPEQIDKLLEEAYKSNSTIII